MKSNQLNFILPVFNFCTFNLIKKLNEFDRFERWRMDVTQRKHELIDLLGFQLNSIEFNCNKSDSTWKPLVVRLYSS